MYETKILFLLPTAPDDLIKIHKFLALLQKLMDTEKGTPAYWEVVNQLPLGYRECYHFLLQWSMQFIIMSSTAKRGREGNFFLSIYKLNMIRKAAYSCF